MYGLLQWYSVLSALFTARSTHGTMKMIAATQPTSLVDVGERAAVSANNNMNDDKLSNVATPRYSGPSEGEMNQQQIEIRDEIIRSRPRTGLNGPFGPWLAVPNIARPAQALGKACRYDTSLSMAESELIILLTGAKMKSHTEFDIHADEALKSGHTMELIQSIPRDENFTIQSVHEYVIPMLEKTRSSDEFKREKSIVLFTAELLNNFTVSDYTYNTTKECLGGNDAALVEITSIVGYYTYVAFTLNVFNIPAA